MADFDTACAFLLANEGGLSDNPNDSGGITRYGISLRFLKTIDPLADEDTIRTLTTLAAKNIYYAQYWQHAPFATILNQEIASYTFDMAVHMGIGQAIKLLQRAIWACYKDNTVLLDDGVLGEKTLKAIQRAHLVLPYALMAERAGFCRLLAATNDRDATFLSGWLKRVYSWPSI